MAAPGTHMISYLYRLKSSTAFGSSLEPEVTRRLYKRRC